MPYSVPEGYFESLPTRLSEIPSRKKSPARYLPIAAAVAALLVAGGFFFGRNEAPAMAYEDEIVEYLIDSGVSVSYLENINS